MAATSAASLLQTVQLEHLPSSHHIHLALYRNITNAAFLHQQLLAGNSAFEYALIDASVIVSKIHGLAATYRAVNDMLEDRLKSRNVHSEIVFSLSPNNNIAESFRRFGISPATTSLLVIKVSTPAASFTAAEVQAHLQKVIQGEQVPFDDDFIAEMTDLARVRKIYKLNNNSGSGGKKSGVVNGTSKEKEERKDMEISILGSIALRGATN